MAKRKKSTGIWGAIKDGLKLTRTRKRGTWRKKNTPVPMLPLGSPWMFPWR